MLRALAAPGGQAAGCTWRSESGACGGASPWVLEVPAKDPGLFGLTYTNGPAQWPQAGTVSTSRAAMGAARGRSLPAGTAGRLLLLALLPPGQREFRCGCAGAELNCVTRDGSTVPSERGGAVRSGWGRPGGLLDPLAALLRERCASRAELSRISGLGYQTLRTYTDGRWTADRLPPVRVLAGLSRAVDPVALQVAVRRAMLARFEQTVGPPPLSWGQRVVLEALRGFDDDVLVAAAPHVHDLIAGFPGRV